MYRFFLVGLILLALTGCRINLRPTPQPTIPPVSASPTATIPQPTATLAPTLTVVAPTETATTLPTATTRPAIKRVLIISLDGLRPDAIALAPMPNLLALMQTSAYSLKAQTIYPSVTLPSHASMLTGLCPAQTGVDWNDYLPARGVAKGTSLFALAKQAGLRTVMIVGKKKLIQITPPETLDVFQFINDRDVVLADLAAPILKQGFDVAFIHLATIDDMGHAYGWLSPQQISVIRRADEAIGTILSALEEAGLRQDTLLIISADHGGHAQTHGSKLPEDMTIPWVVNGPGVIPQTISQPINTTDTAATAAWALKLALPSEWVGRPVTDAFGEAPTQRVEPRCP